MEWWRTEGCSGAGGGELRGGGGGRYLGGGERNNVGGGGGLREGWKVGVGKNERMEMRERCSSEVREDGGWDGGKEVEDGGKEVGEVGEK